MKHLVFFIALLGLVSLGSGQVVPYYGGATTAGGSAMTGMANAISAKGDYNVSTSQAALNMTQVQKQEIENRQQYTNTYFEMRETNRRARAAESSPRLSAEQLARIASESMPKPLSPGDANDVTGKLNWPQALQEDAFAADRQQLEKLFGSHSQMGNLSYADQSKTRQIIDKMAKTLKAQIRMIPAPDYIKCRNFLNSLLFTTCNCRLG